MARTRSRLGEGRGSISGSLSCRTTSRRISKAFNGEELVGMDQGFVFEQRRRRSTPRANG